MEWLEEEGEGNEKIRGVRKYGGVTVCKPGVKKVVNPF